MILRQNRGVLREYNWVVYYIIPAVEGTRAVLATQGLSVLIILAV